MIFLENGLLADNSDVISWSAGRQFSCNIIPYFCRKLGKMSQNLASAEVLIGASRVKNYNLGFQLSWMILVFDEAFSLM